MHQHALAEPVTITSLVALLDRSSGSIMKRKPRCIGNNASALVEITSARPLCLEKYADIRELGRVVLRVGGVTVAAGLVTEIY